jgi:hypothetical protein
MGASSSPAAALEHLKHLIQDLIERHGQPSFSHEWAASCINYYL